MIYLGRKYPSCEQWRKKHERMAHRPYAIDGCDEGRDGDHDALVGDPVMTIRIRGD